MRLHRLSIVAVLLLALNAAAMMPARVIRVIDGDTLEVEAALWLIAGKEAMHMKGPLAVRVLGVDTPELYSRSACEREMAQRAKAFVIEWIGDGDVQIAVAGLDKYSGRIDAHVLKGGRNLSDDLIASGLGRVYAAGARGAWC